MVYYQALRADDLQAGFKRAGIYPLNLDIIPKENFIPAELYDCMDSDRGLRTLAEDYDMFACNKIKRKQNKIYK
ncbi:hypothetical protein DPMN_163193 [Dreissena polymorpha]|uniref:Uncharacterized protein n=1 Tax=Dreissena polymorpha TaxID=45954 RepID=A0A9D4EQR0_DREPO|nr:hypothetical protein DPMN_163193 [Dreissena polymorpha]